jgi:hypothetical protein
MVLVLLVQVVIFGLITAWYFVIRPRHGKTKNAPPLVSSSTVYPIPIIGHIVEFFKSPHSMVKRCYDDYGPVFTIPVRFVMFTDKRPLLSFTIYKSLKWLGFVHSFMISLVFVSNKYFSYQYHSIWCFTSLRSIISIMRNLS